MFSSLSKGVYKNRKLLLWIGGILLVYFFVFFHLTRFPEPWFDEGSHLHVPKTLVKYGVYADYSEEGFRYYGPTIGVGPTVMLPVAAMFKLFGIGLLQARILMALYLIAAVYAFYLMVNNLSGKLVAFIAVILMVSSRSVLFLYYGRQLLGEVPGFFFLVLGVYLWLSRWDDNRNWKRLSLVGLLLGLAMITKYQYLLFLAPMLIISWFLDIVYYKNSSHLNFLIPGIIAAGSFGIWQLITLQYLGPATASENFALLKTTAEGAAFNFNLKQIISNFDALSSRAVYLEALLPALIYGFFISIPRTKDGQRWSVIFLLVSLNLGWFVVTSIGWIRYAFLGLALASIFIARLFFDITNGFKFEWNSNFFRSLFDYKNAYRFAISLWLVMIVMTPMSKNILEILFPGPDYASQMSAYLNANVPQNAVIETWDPEMGFLTDHNYHYPPNELLALAVQQVYGNGAPAKNSYNYVETEKPQYVLLGEFSKWTEIYPFDALKNQYMLVASFGKYDLYKRIDQ